MSQICIAFSAVRPKAFSEGMQQGRLLLFFFFLSFRSKKLLKEQVCDQYSL